MKLICPSCQSRVDIGAESRYDIFTCNCGRRFRGIWANLAALDFVVNKYLNPLSLFWGDSYELPNHTACPYCNSRIRIGDGGSSSPSHCWACGKGLPTSRINENTNNPRVEQPVSTQQVAVAPADPFANYPKNRHEEFLVEVEFIRTVLSNPNLKQFILDKCWTEAELDEAQRLLNLPPYLVAKVKNDFMFKYHNGIDDE